MKIRKPKGLHGVNGKLPIGVADILPYLPEGNWFFDCRHWVAERLEGGAFSRSR